MTAQARWLPEEEAWLESQIIARGLTDGHSGPWVKALVADFRHCFPCQARETANGKPETQSDMMMRWNDIPRVNNLPLNHSDVHGARLEVTDSFYVRFVHAIENKEVDTKLPERHHPSVQPRYSTEVSESQHSEAKQTYKAEEREGYSQGTR